MFGHLRKAFRINVFAEMHVDTAIGNCLDFLLHHVAGQAELGDAPGHLAAKHRFAFEQFHGVSQSPEFARCGKASRTAADNRDTLASGFVEPGGQRPGGL